MITFWVVAVALLVAVVALLAVPLIRKSDIRDSGVDHDRSNVTLFQDQLSELERDRTHGLLTDDQFEQARIELGQRLLAEVGDESSRTNASSGPRGTPWRYAVLSCVPVAALVGYIVLGTPEAMDPGLAKSAQGGSPADHSVNLEQLAERLAQRLESNPDDTEAWVLLARSYQMLGRNPEAVKAFARAVQLVPNSAQLYADYADVQVGAAKGQWTEDARAAVRKAIELDPAHPKAIWLAGTDAFMQQNYVAALRLWEKLPALVEPNSEAAQVVQNNIAEARKLAGIAATADAAPTPVTEMKPVASAAPGAETVKGIVNLDANLRGDVKPTDAVFVFARAAQGPKMPLAIRRITVQELPYTFALDDSAAMAPGMSISKFGEVVIGARVSKSGEATAKAGDLEGYSAPVKPGTSGIEVRINARVQ